MQVRIVNVALIIIYAIVLDKLSINHSIIKIGAATSSTIKNNKTNNLVADWIDNLQAPYYFQFKQSNQIKILIKNKNKLNKRSHLQKLHRIKRSKILTENIHRSGAVFVNVKKHSDLNDIKNFSNNGNISTKRIIRHISTKFNSEEEYRIKKVLEEFKNRYKKAININDDYLENETKAKNEIPIQLNLQHHQSYNDPQENFLLKRDKKYKKDSENVKINEDKYNLFKCPKCHDYDINKIRVTQEQLKKIRIDFVKRQILEKLRLNEPPQVTAMEYLPQPIVYQLQLYTEKSKKGLDDYYARTSKKFLILEREYKQCNYISRSPAICFSFKIDEVDAENIDVNQAVLWLYNRPNRNHQMKQTLVVSEFEHQISSNFLPKLKPIAIKSVDVDEGWIQIDIAWPVKKWVGFHELSHLIHITCNSCVVALEKEYQPFIVIDTQFRRSRQKRNVNCSPDVKECCREKLFISFKEIGWGDWIISPSGYNAYFCRGSCNSIASIASSNNHHSLVIKTLKDKFDRPLELIPCCTPKQFSQLELLFRDSNNTISQKFLPNMIVESCGCM